MKTTLLSFILFLCSSAFFLKTSGQTTASFSAGKADTSIGKKTPFTIVYDIVIKSNKRKTDIEETYNGGTKAIFINKDLARIRLVSLMRIQSLYFASQKSKKPFSIVKESGKKKYKVNLTTDEWNLYNSKYASDSCAFSNDSVVILNYTCRKAFVTLKDGRHLTVYYTTELKPFNPKIEPAFRGIPGLVLQYEFENKKGTIKYIASKISTGPITASIFKIPVKGYKLRKYCANCTDATEEKDISEDLDSTIE